MAEETIRLTVNVPEPVKARFKSVAALVGLDMGELLCALCNYTAPLIEGKKVPADLHREIERAKQAKKTDAGE